MYFLRNLLFVAGMVLLLPRNMYAQELSKEDKALYKEALGAFNDEEFLKARNRFNLLVNKYPEHFEINYYLGACYLNTRYQKTEAIPNLSKAVAVAESSLPAIVHKDLGNLYHASYNFEKAMHHFQRYLKLADSDDEFYPYCTRMVDVCMFASELIKDTLNLNIKNLGKPVNTFNSEFAPYVSTDDSVLFFTKRDFYTDEELADIDSPDTTSQLFISYKTTDGWTIPKKVELFGVDNQKDVSMAGISPDGEYIYINAFNGNQQDIYVGRYLNDFKLQLEPLPAPINSPYWEGKVTISADGNSLWFASDRPESIGGKDIFKTERTEEGTWSVPKNVGEPINTIYDEDAPFIHPGNSLFYFSSTGHNTMGGYDIFTVLLGNKNLFIPENMGFPINTTGDDTYFILSANGKNGYFSSSFGNTYGTHDLYTVKMNMNIPLTLVKGTIKAGEEPKPIAAKIRVFEAETGKKLRYIYNPNPTTGRFLMIFPPGKNYEMVVEADNYIAKRIDIFVPNQEVFYELYQNILLNHVLSMGKKVGERVKVENIFNETTVDTTPKDYGELFDLIDSIIETTDSLDQETIEEKGFGITQKAKNSTEDPYNELFEMVDEAFETGNIEVLNAIQEQAIIPDKFEQVYFYSENENDNMLETKVYGKDTIVSSPPLLAFGERPEVQIVQNDLIKRDTQIVAAPKVKTYEKPKEIVITPKMLRESKETERKVITTLQLFFDVKQFVGKTNYSPEFDQIAELLVNNDRLGLMVVGYSDTYGEEEMNKLLSQKRALWALENIVQLGFNPNRSIVVANGEQGIKPELNEDERAANRKVVIKIFELNSNGSHE